MSVARFAIIGSSSIFIFLAILLVISRIPAPETIPPAVFLAAASAISAVLLYINGGIRTLLTALLSIAGFVLLLFFWAYVTRSFYDTGHDSYAYHLRAVWDLADGWDPFVSEHKNIWVDSYPSGYWVLQSYVVSITGFLLSGHGMVTGLMAVTGLLAYGFFIERVTPPLGGFHHLAALIFAGIIAANPVVLTQLMTHYVDAPLYLMGTALVLFLMTDALSGNRLALWAAIACIILLINTKTAALYFTPLIIFGAFCMEMVLTNRENGFISRTLQWMKAKGFLYMFAGLFAILVIGYKPYVTNVLHHGTLLYPSVDKIMAPNMPENVNALPVPVKFFYGIFSVTADNHWPIPIDAPIVLKIPGTFKKSEFKELIFDTRRGGFGPYFSLAFLTSILAYGACRLAARNRSSYRWQRTGDGIAAFAIVLALTCMFFPESWWARYVPHAWLAAALFGLSSLFLSGNGKMMLAIRALQWVAMVSFMLCILAGLIGAGRQNLNTYKNTQEIHYMKELPMVELSIWKGGKVLYSSSVEIWEALLKMRGVKTRAIPDDQEPACNPPHYLWGGVHWCPLKEGE
jgi:hypothetical protein